MPRYPDLPPEACLSRAITNVDNLQFRIERAIGHLRLSPLNAKRLRAALGLSRHLSSLTLADVQLRKASLQILFDVIEDLGHDLIPDQVPMFHLTLVDDIGLTTDRHPSIPLARFRRKVDKAVRKLGLSGIAMLEIQGLTNYPAEGKGRTLMLNAHVLGWGRVSRRTYQDSLRKLNSSRSWTNTFNALPVKSRKLKSGLEDALKIAVYQAKAPFGAKYRVPRKGHPGEFRFRPTLSGFTDTLALRIMEGLSQISIFDAVFCIGEAKHVRKEWKARLMAWNRLRDEVGRGSVRPFDVAEMWRGIRRRNGHEIYDPFVIE